MLSEVYLQSFFTGHLYTIDGDNVHAQGKKLEAEQQQFIHCEDSAASGCSGYCSHGARCKQDEKYGCICGYSKQFTINV